MVDLRKVVAAFSIAGWPPRENGRFPPAHLSVEGFRGDMICWRAIAFGRTCELRRLLLPDSRKLTSQGTAAEGRRYGL